MERAEVDRRRFLRDGAVAMMAVAAPALAACGGSASRTRRRLTRTTGTTTGVTTGTTTPALGAGGPTASMAREEAHLDAQAWRTLGRSLSGRLVLPSERGYAVARQLFDPRFDTARPAAIAYCATPADVQRAVDFARTHGVRPIPRSGHSYGGYSTGSGLVIDVTSMHAVTVARARRRGGPRVATVGAGTHLIDLYAGCARAGVLVPGGSCPTVGIAGLALGGGIGVVGRKYGLTCDATRAVRIVTADGRLLTCDASSDPDLYWASRGGGGGNFGVVTSFTFTTHPVPELTLFTVDWPWAAAGPALGGWMAWLRSVPDELWSNFQLLSAGSSGLVARASGVLVGGSSSLARLVSGLKARVGASPSSAFVGSPDPYLHAMLVEAGCENMSVAACHLQGRSRGGTLTRSCYAAKSAYVARPFADGGVMAAVDAVAELRSEHPGLAGGLAFDAYGGAINRVAPGATAFVHRRALCAIQATVTWPAVPTGPAFAVGEGWLRAAGRALRPHTTGGAYQNYIDPHLANWARAYYGSNLERLTAVKRAYDPDDVFRFPQSIPLHA